MMYNICQVNWNQSLENRSEKMKTKRLMLSTTLKEAKSGSLDIEEFYC
jgi:hypothetical protein